MYILQFESFVNSKRCQTIEVRAFVTLSFESFVNSKRCQTESSVQAVQCLFESFVNSKRCQTSRACSYGIQCLRALLIRKGVKQPKISADGISV